MAVLRFGVGVRLVHAFAVGRLVRGAAGLADLVGCPKGFRLGADVDDSECCWTPWDNNLPACIMAADAFEELFFRCCPDLRLPCEEHDADRDCGSWTCDREGSKQHLFGRLMGARYRAIREEVGSSVFQKPQRVQALWRAPGTIWKFTHSFPLLNNLKGGICLERAMQCADIWHPDFAKDGHDRAHQIMIWYMLLDGVLLTRRCSQMRDQHRVVLRTYAANARFLANDVFQQLQTRAGSRVRKRQDGPHKVFCLVPVVLRVERLLMDAVIDTWGEDCDSLYFFSMSNTSTRTGLGRTIIDLCESFPAACRLFQDPATTTPDGYLKSNVILKTFLALLWIRREALDFDVICKLDPDTLFIPANLRRFLHEHRGHPLSPGAWYLGYLNYWAELLFGMFVDGGAGICFSSLAFERLANRVEQMVAAGIPGDVEQFDFFTTAGRPECGLRSGWGEDSTLHACFLDLEIPVHPGVRSGLGVSIMSTLPIACNEAQPQPRASLWYQRALFFLLQYLVCDPEERMRSECIIEYPISFHPYKDPAQLRQAYDLMWGRAACLRQGPATPAVDARFFAGAKGGVEYLRPRALMVDSRLDVALLAFLLGLALRGRAPPAGRLLGSGFSALAGLARQGGGGGASAAGAGRPEDPAGAASSAASALDLLESMRAGGFDAAWAVPVLLCGETYSVADGAHRVAAAVALDLALVPVRVCRAEVCPSVPHGGGTVDVADLVECPEDWARGFVGAEPGRLWRNWNYRYFQELGLAESFGDLAAYEATVQKGLHLLHIWPAGLAALEKRMALAQFVDDVAGQVRVWYRKQVEMPGSFALHYLRHAYGDQPWLVDKPVAFGPLTVLWIQASDKEAEALRDRCRLMFYGPEGKLYFDTFDVTGSHQSATVLSQILLFPKSIELLTSAPRMQACSDFAREVGEITASVALEPPIMGGRREPPWPVISGVTLGPRAVRYMQGLSRHRRFDFIVHEGEGTVVRGLLARRKWSRLVVPEQEILHDPRNYGYCYGIRFLAPEAHRYVVSGAAAAAQPGGGVGGAAAANASGGRAPAE